METAPLLPSAVAPKLRRRQSSLSLSEERSKTWWNGVLAFLLALLLLAVVGGLWASQTAPKIPSDTPDFTKLPGPKPGLRNPNYLVSSLHGAVASEVGICSEIGTQVLREGGTATDAGIAAVLCIGVTNMFSSGIGGGGFLVIRPSTTHANLNSQCTGPISIDFRETAPAASYARMFTARPHEPDFDPKRASRVGGLSVGVPGEIRGLEAAYKTCGGGVPWARLFQPSADLARSSFVGKELARRLNFAPFGGTPFSAWMLKAPVWRDQFVRDGKLLGSFCALHISRSIALVLTSCVSQQSRDRNSNAKTTPSPSNVSVEMDPTFSTRVKLPNHSSPLSLPRAETSHWPTSKIIQPLFSPHYNPRTEIDLTTLPRRLAVDHSSSLYSILSKLTRISSTMVELASRFIVS